MKPKIVYVDNEIDNVHNFQGTFDDSFDVIPAKIQKTLDEMVDYLIQLNADGYVIDYLFSDTMPDIKYTGAELYNQLRDLKCELPVIILTGQEDKMQHTIYDPYHIISKDGLQEPTQFEKKLLQFVTDHKNKVEKANKRLKELIAKKQKVKLNLSEEEELINLDTFIEKVTFQKGLVPEALKKNDVTERLDKMLAQTAEILKVLKK